MEGDQAFFVQVTGQIESGDFGALDNMYCRYAFHYGQDWTVSAVSAVIFPRCVNAVGYCAPCVVVFANCYLLSLF